MDASNSNNPCRVCNEKLTVPLWFGWVRCLACGSDTSALAWEQVKDTYGADYAEMKNQGMTLDEVEHNQSTNLDWFGHHRNPLVGNTFLDIGCAEGAALVGMAKRGWAVHGFDRLPEAKMASPPGHHITIADQFRANLFVQRFSAIQAREVIEHVPAWLDFLTECFAAVQHGGLVQIQTPRPIAHQHPLVYQDLHLQIISPLMIRYWAERIGFDVLDVIYWETGQCWMLRRVV